MGRQSHLVFGDWLATLFNYTWNSPFESFHHFEAIATNLTALLSILRSRMKHCTVCRIAEEPSIQTHKQAVIPITTQRILILYFKWFKTLFILVLSFVGAQIIIDPRIGVATGKFDFRFGVGPSFLNCQSAFRITPWQLCTIKLTISYFLKYLISLENSWQPCWTETHPLSALWSSGPTVLWQSQCSRLL